MLFLSVSAAKEAIDGVLGGIKEGTEENEGQKEKDCELISSHF